MHINTVLRESSVSPTKNVILEGKKARLLAFVVFAAIVAILHCGFAMLLVPDDEDSIQCMRIDKKLCEFRSDHSHSCHITTNRIHI